MVRLFNCLVFLSLFGFWCLVFSVSGVKAIYSPGSVPNNRYGVHILDPMEIEQAGKLVNSSGGSWGYVTVPIRSNDLNYSKWFTFFQKCRDLQLIPIIRLSTYPDQKVWFEPDVYDLVDFANFLDQMPWPTQNRYIVLFNEPNHHSEWGGRVDPLSYVHLLLDAKPIFKSRSEDFFLLTAGFDMSAPNSATSMDALTYYRQMTAYQPNWYDSIDGLSVHAYPNPAFSSPISSTSRYGLKSYTYEQKLLTSFGFPAKPLFVTETGSLRPENFYPSGISTVLMSDPQIVAITPFILFAGSPDFAGFSLLDKEHNPKASYLSLQYMPKIAGSPLFALYQPPKPTDPSFSTGTVSRPQSPNILTKILNFIFHREDLKTLLIANSTIKVEIRDTDSERASGLSGRAKLPDNSGMLFIFPNSATHGFWMKDMRFALDFVWINNNRIVELTPHVLPPGETNNIPQVVTPKQPVNWVLEVPSGFIAANGLKIGDSVVVHSSP